MDRKEAAYKASMASASRGAWRRGVEAAAKANKGRPWTPEHRKALSEAKCQRTPLPDGLNHLRGELRNHARNLLLEGHAPADIATHLTRSQCTICGRRSEDNGGRLALDHCHATKRYRGTLCRRCNTLLGYALDRPDTLRRAADYLEGK